ncbi:MAG: transport-associated protein [Acidobacteria bacterium OLB17]|nr:MAG: transport-associated protein [Acidobacteria bacterium OLB17]MCZ2389860.1 BON domain-containing protein [Acidobacteriota bacterium]
MKLSKTILFLTIAALFAFAGSTFAQNNSKTAAGSATALEKKIMRTIENLPNYGVFDHISFALNDSGQVTLSGKVLSLGTSSIAKKAVEKLPGVTGVVNNIENLSNNASDDHIRHRMLATLAPQPVIGGLFQEPNPSVRIIVEHGRVSLEGWVANQGQKDTIYVLASGVPGVFKVTNDLRVGKEKV